MSKWLRVALLVVLFGISKGHHIIKIVVLAALGLAGLWMVHTLAQDYQNISGNHGGGGGGGKGEYGVELTKYFSKRSANFNQPQSVEPPEIDWEKVLSRDPASCARSFVCQLTAQPKEGLTVEEKNILNLIRYSAQKESWASNQLQSAIKHGNAVSNPVECKKFYKFCPYSSRMMMTLLRVFGDR